MREPNQKTNNENDFSLIFNSLSKGRKTHAVAISVEVYVVKNERRILLQALFEVVVPFLKEFFGFGSPFSRPWLKQWYIGFLYHYKVQENFVAIQNLFQPRYGF